MKQNGMSKPEMGGKRQKSEFKTKEKGANN